MIGKLAAIILISLSLSSCKPAMNSNSSKQKELSADNFSESQNASQTLAKRQFINISQAIEGSVDVAQPVNSTVTTLHGKNEGIIDVQGNKILSGWACTQGSSVPVEVKIYRGVIGGGIKVYLGKVIANLANSSPAVSSACQNTGNHGFQYTISDSLKALWSGQELSVEVTSSGTTKTNLVLPMTSTGLSMRIPPLPSLNTNQFTGAFSTVIDQSISNSLPVYANYGLSTQTPVKKLLDFVYLGARYIGTKFLSLPDDGSTNKSGIWSNSIRTKMVLNTIDLQNRGLYSSIVGGGPHIWVAEDLSVGPYPWFAGNQDLVLQVNATMPIVNLTAADGSTGQSFPDARTPVTQLSFGFYLRDDMTGKSIAFIIPIYESRGPYSEQIGNDTTINFASSPLLDNSQYITKSPQSKLMQSQPYGGSMADSFFRVHISATNLTKVINDANSTRSAGLSTDLKNYRITQAGLMFEFPNYVEGASNISEANVAAFSVYLNRY